MKSINSKKRISRSCYGSCFGFFVLIFGVLFVLTAKHRKIRVDVQISLSDELVTVRLMHHTLLHGLKGNLNVSGKSAMRLAQDSRDEAFQAKWRINIEGENWTTCVDVRVKSLVSFVFCVKTTSSCCDHIAITRDLTGTPCP